MKNVISSFLLLITVCSCTWNNQPDDALIPTREESVGIFSSLHKTVRDTERGVYGLMYGARDGIDSFVYDVQKDYYQDYQK